MFDSKGNCLHCGQDTSIFWGREVCDHIHYPENCSICQQIIRDRKKQREIANVIILDKYGLDACDEFIKKGKILKCFCCGENPVKGELDYCLNCAKEYHNQNG